MKIKLLLSLLLLILSGAGAHAQSFTFSYQGELKDGTAPANGTYDFRFRLTNLFGAQVGTVQQIDDVEVIDGIFTVYLNFGEEPFTDGAFRSLEISVKKDAEKVFTTLAPGQPLVSVPYAIKAYRAGSADSATYAENAASAQNAANAANADNAVTAQNAENAVTADFASNAANAGKLDGIDSTGFARISNGTISGNVINAETQYNFSGGRFIYTVNQLNNRNLFIGLEGPDPALVTDDNNTFIGNRAGFSLTDGNANTVVGSQAGEDLDIGNGNSFFGSSAGRENTFGTRNSFFGVAAGRVQISGQKNSYFGAGAGGETETGFFNTFIGASAGRMNETGNENTTLGFDADVGSTDLTFATAIGSRSRVFASNTIALGRPDGSDKVVIYGIGSGGSAQLCRNGSSQISFCSSSLRYKKNIRPFVSGLDLVRELKPITFDWKDGGRPDLGLGAEDVAETEPLLVTYDSDGRIEGVKYDRLGIVLLNAVKEQQTQIERREKENGELRRLIEAQRKRLDEQDALLEELRDVVCAQTPEAAVCRNEKRSAEVEN